MSSRPLRGVITEGPDCSGKTSFTKHLKALLSGGWDSLQMGHKSGDQFKRYMKVYGEADRLLMDRGHYSEVVYGDLFRGGRHFVPWERRLLDDMAREDFITVLFTSPPEVLVNRYHIRPLVQAPMADEDIVKARAGFMETVGPHAAFVFTTHPLESFSFEDAARTVAEQLIPRLQPVRDEADRTPEFIVVEDDERSGAPVVLSRLRTLFPHWNVTSVQESALTAAAIARMHQSVAAQGVVVVCESSSSASGAPARGLLDRSAMPYHTVRVDDTSSVGIGKLAMSAVHGEIHEVGGGA